MKKAINFISITGHHIKTKSLVNEAQLANHFNVFSHAADRGDYNGRGSLQFSSSTISSSIYNQIKTTILEYIKLVYQLKNFVC